MNAEEFEEAAILATEGAAEASGDETGDAGVADFGVVSAISALNFVGASTTYSCRGHNVGTAFESIPGVRFVGDGTRTDVLKDVMRAAQETGCVVATGGDGLLLLTAPSVDRMYAFAERLVSAVGNE